MRIKLFTTLFLLCCFNIVSSQDIAIKLNQYRQEADSLYYNKSESYSENDYLRIQELRALVIADFTDASSKQYQLSLAKKYAADALFLGYDMKHDSAVIYSKKAIKKYRTSGHKDLYFLAHLHKNLYKQYYYANDYDHALLHAEKARDIFKDTLVYNHKLVAEAEFDIGFALGRFEDYTKIIEQYKKAISLNISSRGEYNEDVAIQEHHLALVYDFVGFYKKELDSYLKVVKRWEAIEANDIDMSNLGIAYGSLCTWYLQHGNAELAEQYAIKRENLVKRHKKDVKNWSNEIYKGRTEMSSWYSNANLCLHKGDTLNALLNNKKILDFISNFDYSDKRNNPHNLSYFKSFVTLNKIHALKFKANILRVEQPELARSLYEEALSLEGKDDVSISTLNIKLNLIRLYVKNKEYEKVSKKIDQWIDNAVERNAQVLHIQLMAEKANLAFEQHNIPLMHKEYQLVFKKMIKDTLQEISLEKLNYSDCIPYGDQNFVHLVLKAGSNYNSAFSKTKNERFLQIAHNLNLLASDIFSANFTVLDYNDKTYKTATQINEQLLSTTLSLGNETTFDDILEQIENTNSRLSWRKFLSSNQRKHLNVPDSILSKEEDLKTQLHFYKKQLFTYKESDESKPRVWKEILFDLQKELDVLNNWYKKEYRSYFNQTQTTFDISSLKAKLKKRQIIIKYIFSEDKVYAFTISKDDTQLYFITDRKELSNKLKTLINSLSDRGSADFKVHARSIYQLLLPSQILEKSNKDQLIFILDEELHYMPMEILVANNGKYLIESHAVSYAPSLLLWNEQIGVKKSKKNKLGIFAPTYKKNDSNNPERNESEDLLGANREASQIAELFNTDFFTGSSATKAAFTKNANDYNVLHLAMHATINNIDSEFSYLSFPANQEDSKLFISELYNMSFNADLAVLSACNTSVGNLEKGKGIINVSRAFTYAGVPSTVTSLWKVPDQETSQIMISFYKFLKEGKQKNEALQLAKLDYLLATDDNTLKHPYYWAGFIISGDVTPIKPPIDYVTYVILGTLLLMLGLYLFFNKRRKQSS